MPPLIDLAAIGLLLIALLFGLYLLSLVSSRDRRIDSLALQFVLGHVIFVPWAVIMVFWFHQNYSVSERSLHDIYLYWVICAIFDSCLVVGFFYPRWSGWALRTLKRVFGR